MAVSLCSIAVLALTGCGGSSSSSELQTSAEAIEAAGQVDKSSFPQARGDKTLEQVRQEAAASPTDDTALTPAANNFVAGRVNRLPFGLFTVDREPVWGATVAYVAPDSGSPAIGPFEVAAHALDVPAEFRSDTSQSDYDSVGNGFYTAIFKAGADIRKITVMTLTRDGEKMRSAVTELKLVEDDPTPAPGEKAPAIRTDTLEDAKPSEICTREPADEMHDASLDEVLGKGKPVVLLFSTPALCASRVCGPVNDVATQVQAQTGEKVRLRPPGDLSAKRPERRLRPQVLKYGLTSEPYTFVIDGEGRVVNSARRTVFGRRAACGVARRRPQVALRGHKQRPGLTPDRSPATTGGPIAAISTSIRGPSVQIALTPPSSMSI